MNQLQRKIALACTALMVADATLAALVVENSQPATRQVGGWTIAASAGQPATVPAARVEPSASSDVSGSADASLVAPSLVRLAKIPTILANADIQAVEQGSNRLIDGQAVRDQGQLYFAVSPEDISVDAFAFSLIARPAGNPTHYAYALNHTNPNAPDSASKIAALAAASAQFEQALGGTREQRIAAIYAANQEVLDFGEHSSDLWLIVPSSLNGFGSISAGRIVAELTNTGRATLIEPSSAVLAVPNQAEPAPVNNLIVINEPPEPDYAAQQGCANFAFEAGLLKENIALFLLDCGYTIGQWRFGDAEYEYDMEIPKSYVYRGAGIEDLLRMIANTYLVEGTVNTLDRTVDFEPARGDVLDGMEIEKW